MTSVCWSLQCLISALTQAGGGGLLFRFTCSVVWWGGRGTAVKYHWHVWGTLAVFWPHWVCPRSQHVCFPHLYCLGSRLLYRERALSCVWFQFSGTPQKRRCGWACILYLPYPSNSGSQELDKRSLPGCGAPFPLCGPSLIFHARWSGAPCACSGELISSHNPPGRCQPSRI